MKTLFTYILILFSFLLYAQKNATVTFGHGPDCRGNAGTCTFGVSQNKANSNTQLSFDAKNNELILVITKTDTASKLKLTNNQLEKGVYMYSFNEDFELPTTVLNQLNITDKTKIKKGDYLVKDKGESLLIKVKLE
ncbi:MAG: hypothetical protein L3J09_04840 [Flavobacteriaceae bacterium]|nr:hypothetical protein [Flavobacteriaceae bacterium]